MNGITHLVRLVELLQGNRVILNEISLDAQFRLHSTYKEGERRVSTIYDLRPTSEGILT